MKTLAILGASGHGKVIADAARLTGVWSDIVFYDDAWPHKSKNGSAAVVGNTDSLLNSTERKSTDVIIAIGNNTVRYKKLEQFMAIGFSIATVVHPKAIVSSNAVIDIGTVVLAGAVINSDASIGKAVIINSNAVVEHDCKISDGVHVSPGSCLAGGVMVGAGSWIGIGSTVRQLIKIAENVVVGAGAVVISDIPKNTNVVGVPAKPI